MYRKPQVFRVSNYCIASLNIVPCKNVERSSEASEFVFLWLSCTTICHMYLDWVFSEHHRIHIILNTAGVSSLNNDTLNNGAVQSMLQIKRSHFHGVQQNIRSTIQNIAKQHQLCAKYNKFRFVANLLFLIFLTFEKWIFYRYFGLLNVILQSIRFKWRYRIALATITIL